MRDLESKNMSKVMCFYFGNECFDNEYGQKLLDQARENLELIHLRLL